MNLSSAPIRGAVHENEGTSGVRLAVRRCELGWLAVEASGRGVCAVAFGDSADTFEKRRSAPFAPAHSLRVDTQFLEWVDMVVACVQRPGVAPAPPLDMRGTPFQQRVWHALLDIPVGTTSSYADVAARIGCAGGARAVAGACASNGLAVIVPCHRVVRRDGAMGGYRWGIARKQVLLSRERAAPH